MLIRLWHRRIGLLFSPFFILTGVTGFFLLFRKTGCYEKDTKEFLLGLHNWEIIAPYVGMLLAAGFLFMACSGLLMAWRMRRR